jgi:hypothetical protein
MHPLLIPYSAMALMLLLSAAGRTAMERTTTWLFAWATLLMVLVAVFGRPITGDLSRYSVSMQHIREAPLGEVLRLSEPNSFFLLLNWIIGQMTDDVRVLVIVVGIATVICMLAGSRMLLSRHQTAILFFIYSMYPFFIFFISSGLKSALALGLMLPGLVLIHRGRLFGWVLIGLAILFHMGTLLILPFLFLHLAAHHILGARRGLIVLLGLLAVTIGMSITNMNGAILGAYRGSLELPGRFDIYFEDPSAINYRAGFRLDFTLFSLIPIASHFCLRWMRYPLTDALSGWWIGAYTSLVLIYQLFAFAPFADRFAAFSWFLLPFVLVIQAVESRSRQVMAFLIIVFVLVNLLSLQFYTGGRLLW